MKWVCDLRVQKKIFFIRGISNQESRGNNEVNHAYVNGSGNLLLWIRFREN